MVDTISVSWSLGDGRPRLIVADIGCRLPPTTPGKRRFRIGAKYNRLISGAFGEFVARHLFCYVSRLWIWPKGLVFAQLKIPNSALPPELNSVDR